MLFHSHLFVSIDFDSINISIFIFSANDSTRICRFGPFVRSRASIISDRCSIAAGIGASDRTPRSDFPYVCVHAHLPPIASSSTPSLTSICRPPFGFCNPFPHRNLFKFSRLATTTLLMLFFELIIETKLQRTRCWRDRAPAMHFYALAHHRWPDCV